MNPNVDSQRTSPAAVWSLVLGILGFCTCVTSLPGLILGIIGASNTSKPGTLYKGKGMAIAGIVLSAFSMIFVPVVATIMVIPAMNRITDKAHLIQAQVDVRNIAMACKLYAADNNDQLPPNLQALVEEGYLEPENLINEADPEAGFELLLTGRISDHASNEPLIREPVGIDAGTHREHAVALVDGSVIVEKSPPRP